MDGSQFQPNGMNSNSPYGSHPGVSPHQLQQNSNLPVHTLPPLQPANPVPSYYGGSPHPRTPATPNTPVSAATMNNYSPATDLTRRYPFGNPGNYPSSTQSYRTSDQMMPQVTSSMSYPQTTSSMSYPQAIAPAPSQNRMPPVLRPMPPNGIQQLSGGMQSPYGQANLINHMNMEDQPTHVVGSQGRRGILPSAPGRPPVAASTGKGALIPTKDADGKFPCPHCTKTYLHAKHLKRHLLRHTGDRPYMCVLCRDTFSRSDILKRHFQKCSIRRGNPTGASHLSHAQAHLKKSHPRPHKSTNSVSSESDVMGVNGMGMSTGITGSYGITSDGTIPDTGSNMTEEQAQQLRQSNNLKHLGVGGGNGTSMAGLGSGVSNRASYEQSYVGAMASSMPSGMNPSLAHSLPHGQNGHSYSQDYDFTNPSNNTNGHTQSSAGQEWPQTYHLNSQKNFSNQYTPNTASSQVSIMTEQSPTNGAFSQFYPNVADAQIPSTANASPNISTFAQFSGPYPSTISSQTPTWDIEKYSLGPIAARLVSFCFPMSTITSRENSIKSYFTPSYIEHFIAEFSHFQGHFPLIHVSTFRISEVWDGLILGMMCIGAVYSDRIASTQVRELMEIVKMGIQRNSPVYASMFSEQNGTSRTTYATGKSELEEITALILMQVLFTWHGTPLQREKARRDFPLLVEIARKADLTKPMMQTPSILHQPNTTVEDVDTSTFEWIVWVEQEKRSRLMYTIFLLDSAMVIYFNTPPRFVADEIQLPLPADDAAWDATSASTCADALGLNGPTAAYSSNREGSRRSKQLEMDIALQALLHNVWGLEPGTTNVYSKFILVHALHVRLWTTQMQLTRLDTGLLTPQNSSHAPSGANTPISPYDWTTGVEPGSGSQSANNSGTVTPVDANNQASHLLRSIDRAFDKWKRAWDDDMATQYPPSTTHHHRFGFCRDAGHFYWLAKYLVMNNRTFDSHMAPDQRFSQTMHCFKRAKNWVASDSAKRGAVLGSMSDIDKDYGVTDLTLDMAQLFKPINEKIDSPVAGVQMNNRTGT